MIHVNNFLVFINPENNSSTTGSHSLITRPITNHVFNIRYSERIIAHFIQYILYSSLLILPKFFKITYSTPMYHNCVHSQMLSKLI